MLQDSEVETLEGAQMRLTRILPSLGVSYTNVGCVFEGARIEVYKMMRSKFNVDNQSGNVKDERANLQDTRATFKGEAQRFFCCVPGIHCQWWWRQIRK